MLKDTSKIIQSLKQGLKPLDYVHALWVEGSISQGHNDEYSDLDVWISVDDTKFKNIYEDVEKTLEKLGEIDFRYDMKPNNEELGHIVYHIKEMSQFLTIDVNVQKLSRKIELVRDLDIVDIVFDKSNILKFRPERVAFNKPPKDRLEGYFYIMKLNVLKNLRRNRPLEAFHYYDSILEELIKYFRLQAWHAEKAGYWRKHIYRDLKDDINNRLEYFTFIKPDEMEEKLKELGDWIKSL